MNPLAPKLGEFQEMRFANFPECADIAGWNTIAYYSPSTADICDGLKTDRQG